MRVRTSGIRRHSWWAMHPVRNGSLSCSRLHAEAGVRRQLFSRPRDAGSACVQPEQSLLVLRPRIRGASTSGRTFLDGGQTTIAPGTIAGSSLRVKGKSSFAFLWQARVKVAGNQKPIYLEEGKNTHLKYRIPQDETLTISGCASRRRSRSDSPRRWRRSSRTGASA
jgi:hypothetical protein